MKHIIFTSAILASSICLFSQTRNGSTGNTNVTHNNSNFNTNTQSNTNTVNTNSTNYNSNTRSNTNSNTYSNDSYNSNSNSNSNNSNNSSNSSNNSWSNNNSNSSWSNNNNGYYNNNNYYNNSNNYSNGYNNNNGYTNSNTRVDYEGNYGSDVITGNKGFSSNPFNITNRCSNYRNRTAIDKFFTKNQKPSQIFTIDAQQQNTIKANDGTIILIQPNTFVNADGHVVKGEVTLEVKEMYNATDMILSNASTVSNDMPLISGGEVFIDARQNGEVLKMDNNKPMAVQMPSRIGTKDEMQMFHGEAGNNSVNWTLANANSYSPVANSNSPTGSSYNFSTTAMGWINCDKFMRSNNRGTKIRVNIPTTFDTTNTAIFMVFSKQNTVTRFDSFNVFDRTLSIEDANNNHFYTRWYSVPVGTELTIVSISEINGEYYSSFSPVKITEDHLQTVNPSPTTLEIFKEEVGRLQK
jgi:hypothetical protein